MRRGKRAAARSHTAPLRRAPAVTAIAVGLILIIATVGDWYLRREPPAVGTATAERLAQAIGAPDPPTGRPTTSVFVPVHRGDQLVASPVMVPASLRIPAIRVNATVVPTGVDVTSGEVEVPPRVTVLGWYRHSQGVDAAAGAIAIVGHVDAVGQGVGAFFRLSRISPGDTVTVTAIDGHERTFRVVARERFAKTAMPMRRIFAHDGAPRLTLITCGGRYDARQREYSDNLVVTAIPVTGAR